jgi:hypothetical protein
MWFLFATRALSSVKTVSANSNSLTRKSFSVSKGDYVVVSFPLPNGFIVAAKPNPTSFNVAQGCTDPCSGNCFWFHHDVPGILSLGDVPGVVEYYATSSGTLMLTYGYTGPLSLNVSRETCSEIVVNVGPTTVRRSWSLVPNFMHCFFESDAGGHINSTALSLPVRLYTNAGFSRVLSSGSITPELGVTGLLMNTTGPNGRSMGFDLTFTSQVDRNEVTWLYRYSDARSWPDPVIYGNIDGGFLNSAYVCTAGRDGVSVPCGDSATLAIALGTVGTVSIIGIAAGLVIWMVLRDRREAESWNTRGLASGTGSVSSAALLEPEGRTADLNC